MSRSIDKHRLKMRYDYGLDSLFGDEQGGDIVFGAMSSAPSIDDVRAGKAYIKRGMSGDSVAYVQRIIGVTTDGLFGPGTETALKSFQKKYGQAADGIVGVGTMAALDAAIAVSPSAAADAAAASVPTSTPAQTQAIAAQQAASQATTPVQVQAAAAQAKQAAQNAPLQVQQKVQAAQQAAAQAKTPTEVAAAAKQVIDAAKQVQKSPHVESSVSAFLTQRIGPLPAWGWMAGGAGMLVFGGFVAWIARRK